MQTTPPREEASNPILTPTSEGTRSVALLYQRLIDQRKHEASITLQCLTVGSYLFTRAEVARAIGLPLTTISVARRQANNQAIKVWVEDGSLFTHNRGEHFRLTETGLHFYKLWKSEQQPALKVAASSPARSAHAFTPRRVMVAGAPRF